MGEILAYLTEIGALTTGLYGMTRGWNVRLAGEINNRMSGRLEGIIDKTPPKIQALVQRSQPFVQRSLELVPYTLAVYTTMKVGEQIARFL